MNVVVVITSEFPKEIFSCASIWFDQAQSEIKV